MSKKNDKPIRIPRKPTPERKGRKTGTIRESAYAANAEGLTILEQRFVDAFVGEARFNASEAYRLAAPKGRSGYAGIVGRPHVADAIRRRVDESCRRLSISREDVLSEIAAIAFSDIGDMVQLMPGGYLKLRPWSDLPMRATRVIQSVKETQFGVQISLHPKLAALELLAKHLGLVGASEQSQKSDAMDERFAKLVEVEYRVLNSRTAHIATQNGCELPPHDPQNGRSETY